MELTNVPDLITESFGRLTGYYNSLSGFLQDPESSPKEPGEFLDDLNIVGLRRAVQARVLGQASNTNAALMATFRDLESASAEYQMSKMTRSDYYSEAAAESQVMSSNWKTTMEDRLFNLTGVRKPGA